MGPFGCVMEAGSSLVMISNLIPASANVEDSVKVQSLRTCYRIRKTPSKDYLNKVLTSLRDPTGGVKKLTGIPKNQNKSPLESIPCELPKSRF